MSTPPGATTSMDNTKSGEDDSNSGPKAKRRKVNHACVYCRRSHMTCELDRPCTRCIKRNIGHLCHDEPREPLKRIRGDTNLTALPNGPVPSPDSEKTPSKDVVSSEPPAATGNVLHHGGLRREPKDPSQSDRVALPGVPHPASAALDAGILALNGYGSFGDMQAFHPSYIFNTPEVTNEYNLLNDFLSNSLLDEGAIFSTDEKQASYTDSSMMQEGPASGDATAQQGLSQPSDKALSVTQGLATSIRRPSSAAPNEKAQETYYMTAADPSGNDAPDERIKALLDAKRRAGLLKIFPYVQGYRRLQRYMEVNLKIHYRQTILRQLDKFRPKFRERVHKLTDEQLLIVETKFEECLYSYDRIFASMSIPACCWRRTGEIFRGNKEMAELIQVPIESLRDGKLAIHEIITEHHLASYWEKFGAIAFDISHKAMLTTSALKQPGPHGSVKEIPCCCSLTIRRDEYDIPLLIIGNFLPVTASSDRQHAQSIV